MIVCVFMCTPSRMFILCAMRYVSLCTSYCVCVGACMRMYVHVSVCARVCGCICARVCMVCVDGCNSMSRM